MLRRAILVVSLITIHFVYNVRCHGMDFSSEKNTSAPDSTHLANLMTGNSDIVQTFLQDIFFGVDTLKGTEDGNRWNLANVLSNAGQDVRGLRQMQGISSELVANLKKFDWDWLLLMLFDSLQQQNLSDACGRDIDLLTRGIKARDMWAIQMLDSIFKPPSNILGGATLWLGDKDECEGVKAVVNNTEHFVGKYCTLEIPLGDVLPAGLKSSGKTSLRLGACAASSCSENDVYIIVKYLSDRISNGTVKPVVSCTVDMKMSSDFIVVLCILCVLGALVIGGTIYDVVVQLSSKDENEHEVLISQQLPSYNTAPKVVNVSDTSMRSANMYDNGAYVATKDDIDLRQSLYYVKEIGNTHNGTRKTKTISQAVLSFSFYTNGCKLLSTGQGTESLGSVNGIRFLSMAWVILGHTLYFAMGYDANMLPDYYAKKINQWTFMAIQYATVSVDSFFALSGTLVAYLTLKELKKCGGAKKLNWFMFYFHRFWRLTPPYMLVLMVGTVLFPYVVRGPMSSSPNDYMFMRDCRTNWWTNLLYINNYVNLDKLCMGWTWYLANDMQMYIISPLILLPFFYNFVAGAVVCGLFLLASIASTAVLVQQHHYPAQSVPGAPAPDDTDYAKLIYIASYARLGPYLVGLFTGYLLYKTKCKCRIPKIVNLSGWFLCIAINLLIMYGLYTDAATANHIVSQAESTAYHSLSRVGFGSVVCWIVFSCATGHGGWINQMLSWSPFVPLGRLTYCAYLIHPLVMGAYYGNRNTPIYFSDYEFLYIFLGNIVMSYGAAFIVSLIFESPMMGLEKAIFKTKKH